MTTPLIGRLRVAFASMLVMSGMAISTGVAPSVASAGVWCPGTSTPCIDLESDGPAGYVPGSPAYLNFNMTNKSSSSAIGVQLSVTLPAGMSIDTTNEWNHWPNNGTLTYNRTTRVITYRPSDYNDVAGTMSPWQESRLTIVADVAADVTAPELRIKSIVSNTKNSTTDQFAMVPSKPYVLESTTTFSPDIVAGGGSSTLTSTITNTGTGSARSIYYYINLDDRLIVDTTTVPADCNYYPQDTWTNWEGETIVYPQYLSCHHDGVLASGQSFTTTFTVSAPNIAGPDEFEAQTELSCTSSEGPSHDGTDDGDSTGILRLSPPVPAELHLVQMGGPKPIVMPTATAEPDQPTAGKTHSVVTYVYNIGQTDLTSAVSVVVTLEEGFTPTSITATTDDTGATAPVCTLATRTCVFSQLAGGKQGRISIEGDLAPSIADKTALAVSAQGSATGVSTVTDTNKVVVSAFADVTLNVKATGAFIHGQPVDFMLSAANNGPSHLKSPVIKVTLPAGASFTTVPKDCTASGTTMTCKWSKLEAEGIDGEMFSASFGSATKATASVVLTTSTPLSKDSVTKASASEELASAAVAAAIMSANKGGLPATGTSSNALALIAFLLLAGGAVLMGPMRNRRVL